MPPATRSLGAAVRNNFPEISGVHSYVAHKGTLAAQFRNVVAGQGGGMLCTKPIRALPLHAQAQTKYWSKLCRLRRRDQVAKDPSGCSQLQELMSHKDIGAARCFLRGFRAARPNFATVFVRFNYIKLQESVGTLGVSHDTQWMA